jgi:diguanylate cyclase (GGDEF)-like protein
MSLNPFKKLQVATEAAEVYLRTACLLLQAIELHTIEGESEDYQLFRTSVKALQSRLRNQQPSSEGLVVVGAASKAMEDYNRQTKKFISAQRVEWQGIIRMLGEAISEFIPADTQSAANLREIDRSLGKAVSLDEIRGLKSRLASCLQSVRSHRNEQQYETPKRPQPLSQPGQADSAGNPDTSEYLEQEEDPLTGLPMRRHGEAAIRECTQSDKSWFAVIFVVNRVGTIKARFGHPVGDRIMFLFLQRLAQELLASDQLFRWSGSSFLALLERDGSEAAVAHQISRILLRQQEETFTIAGREVVLTVAATWTVFPVGGIQPDALVGNIDNFVRQTAR